MHNSVLTAKIETDLIQSKGGACLDGTCFIYVVKLVSLKCLCRAGVTTPCWPTGACGVEANPVLVKAPNPVSLFVTQQP